MIRTRMKIQEGIRRGLCGSCKDAHITVDEQGNEAAFCCSMPHQLIRVNRVITECSGYRGANHMSEWDAKQIGWVLEVKGERIIGFKAPSKMED